MVKVTQKMDIYMSPPEQILSKKLIDNFGVIINFGILRNIIIIQQKILDLKQTLMEDQKVLFLNTHLWMMLLMVFIFILCI